MRPSISATSISGENTGGESICIVPKRIFDSEYDENGCIAKSNLGENQVPGAMEIGLPDSIIRAWKMHNGLSTSEKDSILFGSPDALGSAHNFPVCGLIQWRILFSTSASVQMTPSLPLEAVPEKGRSGIAIEA